MMDEEDEDMEDEEEYLNIGTEIEVDPDSPPWDVEMEPEMDDMEETNEDTALLRTRLAKTEIIVTPISPVSSPPEQPCTSTSAFLSTRTLYHKNGKRFEYLIKYHDSCHIVHNLVYQ